MGVLSKTRSMALTTSLGDDALLLERFSYSDELGRLYRMTVDATAGKDAVTIESAIGKPATLRVRKSDGEQRYFNGIVSKVTQNGVAAKVTSKTGRQKIPRYQLTIVPAAWMLTRHSDCRIFQNETIPDIIKKVFAARGIGGFLDTKLRGTYKPHDYIVQYRETDFNFVSRLMEFEGIYYYFAHENGSHKLVLADGPSSHAKLAGYSTIPFYPHQAVNKHDRIMSWHLETEVQSGQIALQSYDFKNPSQPHNEIKKVDFSHLLKTEVFDYPVEFHKPKDAATYAKLRAEELAARAEMAVAETDCRGVCCGGTFKLTDPTQELRKQECKEYLVAGVDVHGTAPDHGAMLGRGARTAEEWTCSFRAVPARRQFRPARITPKPIISGPQTAIVVGAQGAEIEVDKYARVKVQFHWDRYGKYDDKSSCWIRVNQPWAGKGYGGLNIPRTGCEVIVEFLEGDPDRPIITGRVYNGQTMPYGSQAGVHEQKRAQSKLSLISAQSVIATARPIAAAASSGGPPGARAGAVLGAMAAALPAALAILAKLGDKFAETKISEPLGVIEAAQMTSMKSNSLGGSGGSNEITMSDAGGSEAIFVKAQKDEIHTVNNDMIVTVLHDMITEIMGDRTTSIHGNDTLVVDKDSRTTITKEHFLSVGADSTVKINSSSQTLIGDTHDLTIAKKSDVTIGDNSNLTISKNQDTEIGQNSILKIGGNQETTIVKDSKVEIKENSKLKIIKKQETEIGEDSSIKIVGNQETLIDGNHTASIKGDDKLTIEKSATITVTDKIKIDGKKAIEVTGADEIALKCGTASITLKKSGDVEIKGVNIKIEATAKLDNKGALISSVASALHEVKGTLVKINC